MRHKLAYRLALCLLPLAPSATVNAEDIPACKAGAGQPEQVKALEDALLANYVFPARVPDIMADIRKAASSPRYAEVSDQEFARLLGEDLVTASSDLHFMIGIEDKAETKSAGFSELEDPRSNFGFQTTNILPGNIGYLRFDNFSEPDAAFATATAALKLLENVDGLIIDLRYNNGGYNDLAQLIASHLFDNEDDQLLISYYYNKDGKRVERGQWVLSGVPGRRRPDMPVHILTSSVTFSAAEWMAFSLQKLGRATIVGAQTAGGGHPVERIALCGNFFAQIPVGEIRAPKGGEFEGVGVAPDMAVPSYKALEVSHLRMLEHIHAHDPGTETEWALARARAARNAVRIDQARLKAASGTYAGRELIYDDDGLTYRWLDRFILRLTPLSEDLFAVEGTDAYRIELVRSGKSVTALARIFPDGARQVYERTS